MAIIGGVLAANDLFLISVATGVALIGMVIIYFCLFKPIIGFYIVCTFSFFVFYPNHLLGRDILPLNTVLEILLLFVFLGTQISRKSGNTVQQGLIKTFVYFTLLLLTFYLAIQVFNPNVYGFSSWFAAFKRSLVFVLIYIIAYHLINTEEKFKYFIRFWIFFSFIVGAYGCYQQWFGYFSFELNYIRNIPGAFELLNQGGQLRKFSFLSDVVSFGVLGGCMAVFTLLLGINENSNRRKIFLFFIALIMALGMSYSGTRTTTIIIPAGLALYCLVTIQNKATILTIFITILAAMGILFAPIYHNPTLNRIRSTFDAQDASLDVRNINRHYIQPYLQEHAFGGGIGTTNNAGLYNHPYHKLAGFATDSGYLKAGLELGWIGLALLMLFNLAILYQGINYYFKMKDKKLKVYMVIILCTLFPNIITQYAQETVGQFPFGIFFFSSLSLMTRLFEFDKTKTAIISNTIV